MLIGRARREEGRKDSFYRCERNGRTEEEEKSIGEGQMGKERTDKERGKEEYNICIRMYNI